MSANNDSTNDPLPNASRVARVTKVYAHTEAGDNSNYEVDVRLVDAGDPTGGAESTGETASTSGNSPTATPDHTRIPVQVPQAGMVHGITEDTLVSVAFRGDHEGGAYVNGVFYSASTRAPLVKPGDWRTRIDESVIETITNDDGERLIRIGGQPEDRGDLEMGLLMNLDKGGFELYDAMGYGLCCDGQGNVVLSQAAGGMGTGDTATGGSGNTNTPPGGASLSGDVYDDVPNDPLGDATYSTDVNAVSDLGMADDASAPIDAELESLSDGTRVTFPAGEFLVQEPLIQASNIALVGAGSGATTFVHRDSTSDFALQMANGGDYRVEGIDIDYSESNAGSLFVFPDTGNAVVNDVRLLGQMDNSQEGIGVAIADPDGVGLFQDVRATDGGRYDEASHGFFVNEAHAGELWIVDNEISQWPDNGLYASSPGYIGDYSGSSDSDRGNGPVHVRGGRFENNNISQARIGTTDATIRGATIRTSDSYEGDTVSTSDREYAILPRSGSEDSPVVNARGIWLKNRPGMVVQDCTIEMGNGTASAALIGGSDCPAATVSNTRITVTDDTVTYAGVFESPRDDLPSSAITFESVTFDGTGGGADAPVFIDARDGTSFTDCVFQFDGQTDGIRFRDSTATVSDTSFDLTGTNIIEDGSSVTVSGDGTQSGTQQTAGLEGSALQDGVAQERPETTETINLADEGVQSGDNIDGALSDSLQDNTTVVIPNGEYESDGSGFEGEYQDAEVVGAARAVDATPDGGTASTTPTITTPAGTDRTTTLTVSGGTVHIRNLEFRGARDGGSLFDVAVTDRNGSFVLADVACPDGDTGSGTPAPAVRVRPEHTGSCWIRNCHLEGFREGGVDAAAPGSEGLGRTVVQGGLYKNNNVANVLLSGAGSRAEDVTSVQTGDSPDTTPARGVWLTEYADVEVDGTDILHTDTAASAAEPLRIGGTPDSPSTTAGDSRAEVRYVRIRNDADVAAVDALDGEFTGANNSVTGSGDLTVSGVAFANTCAGGSCDGPTDVPFVNW